jgi:hypothetical protein
LQPAYTRAAINLGTVLWQQGDATEALAAYQTALRLAPDDAGMHWNMALLRLSLGQLEVGWSGYEWRWQTGKQPQRAFPAPPWDGSPLTGQTILVHAEQGIGDELLFASCLPELLSQARQVIVECDPRLAALFTRSFPRATVYGAPRHDRQWLAQCPMIDVQLPMGSLPCHLRPTLGHFPCRPGYLRPDATQVHAWQCRLAPLGPGLRVGFAWRSVANRRHVPYYTQLQQWAAVLTVPGLHWVNLQYDDYTAELAAVAAQTGVPLHAWPELDTWHDVDGVAALIGALDLVIAPDTMVAQLASGLGVPVWRVSGYAASEMELGTGRSPWSPTLRSYRQERPGEWAGVLARLATDLRRLTRDTHARRASDDTTTFPLSGA